MKVNNVRTVVCRRCGHKWVPRKKEIRICPKCKSAYFDKEENFNEHNK